MFVAVKGMDFILAT